MTEILRSPVSHEFISHLPGLVINHTLNAVFGLLFGLLNIPLLITLLSTEQFRRKYFILIILCLADSSNCIAIFLMGINRVNLYSEVISTLSVPIRTSWECAMEPWLWFRGIGDLWPPMVQIFIAIERCCAVFFPTYFVKLDKTRTRYRLCYTVVMLLYVAIVLSFGFISAWQNQDQTAMYYCGRKASFSNEYGQYIYLSNIVCYSLGLIICVLAYWRCLRLRAQNPRVTQRVRYALVVSLFSTVLVSIPNTFSMLETYVDISNFISKPSVYASSFNSGVNLFIYLVFNSDFRVRFLQLIGIDSGAAVCPS